MFSEKIIKFNPLSELSEKYVPRPRPAKEYIPDWVKGASPFGTKKPSFDIETGSVDKTFKICSPFMDTFSMGYIQETWTDIYIDRENCPENPYYYYAQGPEIMGERDGTDYKQSANYHSQHYLWHPGWTPELPKGYSCIITHPFNRDDLPFRTITGILDADAFYTSAKKSNLPFLLDKNFSGLIKAGTPMYQIIPFKRDDWKSETNRYDAERQESLLRKTNKFFWGGYKKLYWTKKSFK